MAASFRVLPRATARHTRSRESRTARAEQRLRRPRRRARPTARRPRPLGRPARHRRDARPDRAPRRGRPRPRDDAHGADRRRQALRRGGVRQRAARRRMRAAWSRSARSPTSATTAASCCGRARRKPEVEPEIGALDQARAGVRRSAPNGEELRPAARAHRGQGGDRGLALARRARRGGRARGGQAHRRDRPRRPGSSPTGGARCSRSARPCASTRAVPCSDCCATPTWTPRSTPATTPPTSTPSVRCASSPSRAACKAAVRVGVRSDEGPPEIAERGRRGGRRRRRRAGPARGAARRLPAVRFIDFLRATVLTSAGAATVLAVITVLAAGTPGRRPHVVFISAAWWVARRRRSARRSGAAARPTRRSPACSPAAQLPDHPARAPPGPDAAQPAVAAAAVHRRRGRAGGPRAADPGDRVRLRDHLGAGLAPPGRGGHGDRGARRRALLRRPHLAVQGDPARAHAGLPADARVPAAAASTSTRT